MKTDIILAILDLFDDFILVNLDFFSKFILEILVVIIDLISLSLECLSLLDSKKFFNNAFLVFDVDFDKLEFIVWAKDHQVLESLAVGHIQYTIITVLLNRWHVVALQLARFWILL